MDGETQNCTPMKPLCSAGKLLPSTNRGAAELNEPTAAAVAYGLDQNNDGTIETKVVRIKNNSDFIPDTKTTGY